MPDPSDTTASGEEEGEEMQSVTSDVTGVTTEEDLEAYLDQYLNEHHRWIGKIASVWAMIEFRMDQLIWDLCSVKQTYGACITTQLNGTGPRLRSIKALVELHGFENKIITKLNKFGGEIIDPQERRNRTVHDPWFVGTVTKSVTQLRKATVNNRIEYDFATIEIAKLGDIYRASVQCLRNFNLIQKEIRQSMPEPSSDRRRKRLLETKLWSDEPQNQDQNQTVPPLPPPPSQA